MTNWDLFTNPESQEFDKNTPEEEKQNCQNYGKNIWFKKIVGYLSSNGESCI
jgi:hypothetical protein